MKKEYDVIVVGAGPAGLKAAQLIAAAGFQVIVIDKKREIGVPVRCGEAIGYTGAHEVLGLRDHWVSAELDSSKFIAPNGATIEVKDRHTKGYILDRKIFERDLAEDVLNSGGSILLKTYVKGLIQDNDSIAGVTIQQNGSVESLRCRVVVGADGVETRVGRWAGINTWVKPKDMEVTYQYLLSNVNIKQGQYEFYMGRDIAPGGYLWLFPKEKGRANVGIGIAGTYAFSKSPKKYLDEFIGKRFPGCNALTVTTGGVPCCKGLETIVKNGCVLIGDAAHQVNPLTGGGITSGMRAAMLASDVIIEGLRKGLTDATHLKKYEKTWNKKYGKTYDRMYRIKEGVMKLGDAEMNRAAETFGKLNLSEMSLVKLFKVSLAKHPRLLFEIAKAFAGV